MVTILPRMSPEAKFTACCACVPVIGLLIMAGAILALSRGELSWNGYMTTFGIVAYSGAAILLGLCFVKFGDARRGGDLVLEVFRNGWHNWLISEIFVAMVLAFAIPIFLGLGFR